MKGFKEDLIMVVSLDIYQWLSRVISFIRLTMNELLVLIRLILSIVGPFIYEILMNYVSIIAIIYMVVTLFFNKSKYSKGIRIICPFIFIVIYIFKIFIEISMHKSCVISIIIVIIWIMNLASNWTDS